MYIAAVTSIGIQNTSVGIGENQYWGISIEDVSFYLKKFHIIIASDRASVADNKKGVVSNNKIDSAVLDLVKKKSGMNLE